MKKLLSVVIAISLMFVLVSCQSNSADKYCGTWDIEKVEIDGSEYTIDELEALGDDSLVGISLVIKEGGKAFVSENNEWQSMEWELVKDGIKIGERECQLKDDFLLVEKDDTILFFEKESDSQTIEKIKDTNDDTTENAKDDDTEEEEQETEPEESSEEVTEKIDGLKKLEDDVVLYFEGEIESLTKEWESLLNSTDTYENYVNNIDKVEEYYGKIILETEQMCVKMREYAVDFATLIYVSEATFDDKYDESEIWCDLLYDKIGEMIYDEIYDGILEEMYDAYYDGVIYDAYDIESYDDVEDIESDEYDRWSDCSDEIYDILSDATEEIYDFYSDVSDGFWEEDIDEVEEKINDFKLEIDELKK